jgi:tetratricopeptide (TPR) repeat protein
VSTFWVCLRLFAESCREVVRIRTLLSLFLLAAVATSGQEDLPPSLETRLAVGVEALKSGDLVTADKVFSQAVQQGVRHPLVFHNLGVIAQERGDHKRAVVRFRQSLQLKPDYGPSRLLLGVSLMALGKNAEAVRELERAVRLMPNETQAHLQLAKAYETSDNWIAAVPELQRVVELAPQQPEYSYQLGRAWAKLSGWSYQQIRRLNPDSARLQQALGQEYAIQEKYDAALAAYQRAARSDPNLPEIHLAAAVILLELKRFDEALVEIDLEGKLVPDSKAAAEIRAKIDAAKASSSP